MQAWINIFWLGTKELRSVFSDVVMVVLIVYSFSLAVYSQARAQSESVNNASVAIVDEDNSLSPLFPTAETDLSSRSRPIHGREPLYVCDHYPTAF